MLSLPPALSSWSAELDLFPTEIASALAPLVLRLDRIIGPLRSSQRRGDGEPDGVDGLARRGSYERLLISEWLLADEIPLEFARRAANNEHTFLQIARREPQGAPLCVALFDTGPNQIGAPRLAHLAALVVLFRRAQNGGAHFRWGVFQDDNLHETLTESNIRALILARSSREANRDDWTRWRDVVQGFNAKEPPELWIVGGERLQREHRVLDVQDAHVSLLQIRDDWEVSSRQVWAQVLTREETKREIALELPDEKLCAQLLRDPFSVVAAEGKRTNSRYASAGNFIWGGEGKLLSRSVDGRTLVVYPVPNSPRAQVGKPKLYRPDNGDKLVAAGTARKATIAVTLVSPKEIAVQAWGKGASSVPQGRFTLPFALPESRDETLLSCGLLPNAKSPTLLVLLPGRRLLKIATRWNQDGSGSAKLNHEIHFENQNTLALQIRANDAVFVSANDGVFSLKIGERIKLFRGGESSNQAFFGFYSTANNSLAPPTAIEEDNANRNWIVPRYEDSTPELPSQYRWFLPSSTRTQGVLSLPERWPTPALVTVEDERRVVLRGQDWTFELPTLGAPIEHVCASPFAPDFAMRTTTGEIAVYSLNHNAWTLRLSASET